MYAIRSYYDSLDAADRLVAGDVRVFGESGFDDLAPIGLEIRPADSTTLHPDEDLVGLEIGQIHFAA